MSDASIHHKIDEVVVSFQNKLGIRGVLQHSIFVMHTADYQGASKLTEEVLGDGVLGHTDANGPFFSLVEFWDLTAGRQHKRVWPWQFSLHHFE